MSDRPPPALCLPRYDGRSLPNIGATVCRLLGAEPPAATAELAPGLLPPALLEGVNAVVLLLVDGLGLRQLEQAAAKGDAPFLASLMHEAARDTPGVGFASITSVFPSATMAALASLHTALPPTAHGVMGWTVFLEEVGAVVEVARLGPAGRRGSYTDPALGGLDPIAFFGLDTVHRRLERGGVSSIAVGPVELGGSAFSVATQDGADCRPYYAPSSALVLVNQALAERRLGERRLIYAYLSAVDTVAHRRGPWSDEQTEEVAVVDFLLGRGVERLERRGDVLLILTADHGHLHTDPALTIRLDQHPRLLDELLSPPSGERRMSYLHVKPGRIDAVRSYIQRELAGQAAVIPSDEAFARGWFGLGAPTVAARRRAGDLILLPIGEHQLVYVFDPQRPVIPFYGNHGALAPEEMEIPLLALRL
ncbi:MAG: alkaline phosphatase family protein [Chloroflexi bacterium]|nr:alkaline phosphatase family protein [Chloroflexota bacterium]